MASTSLPSKRNYPAKGARTAALGLSLASTGGLAGFFAFANAQNGSEVHAAQIVSAPAPASASAPASAVTPTPGGVSRTVDLSVPAPGVDPTPAPVVDPAPVGDASAAIDPAPAAPASQPAADVVVDGLDWIGRHTGYEAMAITRDATMLSTPGFDDWCRPIAE